MAQGSPIAMKGPPENVVLGDFDNDGTLDLGVGIESISSVELWRGVGNGQFRYRSTTLTLPESPMEMSVGGL